jgi:cell division septation protein DedD
MADESLREIQLNGKQLVFVFMASTVVAVVIFLSGVMVGRTVPDERMALVAVAVDDGASTIVNLEAVPAATDGPVAANEIITYPSYLASSAPPEETLIDIFSEVSGSTSGSVIAPPMYAAVIEPFDTGPIPNGETEPVTSELQEPAGAGFVVQVAAVSARPAAEAIAKDLSTKGYPVFVTTPGPDAPLVFRVRVGKYPDRREAESIAGRLEREEQFRPWITR